MNQEKVRSIGISLLGGNSGAAGKYELGIDSIRIINDEDMAPATSEISLFQLSESEPIIPA
jgi:NADH dehydrogenase [ubiquinone] 1 alpha subcomplex assembly factor 1